MTEHYDIDQVLQRVPELVVMVRGQDFHLWRDGPRVVRAHIDHEYKVYQGKTLDEIKLDLEDYRPGSWSGGKNGF